MRWRRVLVKRRYSSAKAGSIPFVTQMHDTFKVPCVLLGFGLPDENAHAPDEHIALENYYGGIKAVALFYEQLADTLEPSRQVEKAPFYRGFLLFFPCVHTEGRL